ncbi:MAG: YjbQ family protein [Candidatus Lokiarchaeota archaeon]|nr:YjbQ family protein [Candidatus Lokiarchaeota archaeon]
MNEEISVKTSKKEEIIDITNRVKEIISNANIKDGYCVLFVMHTTAGLAINENADPAVRKDVLKILDNAVPQQGNYQHREGNSPAHAKAILTGTSELILISNGDLVLGTWQGIYFCEFDGPRRRKVKIKIFS